MFDRTELGKTWRLRWNTQRGGEEEDCSLHPEGGVVGEGEQVEQGTGGGGLWHKRWRVRTRHQLCAQLRHFILEAGDFPLLVMAKINQLMNQRTEVASATSQARLSSAFACNAAASR